MLYYAAKMEKAKFIDQTCITLIENLNISTAIHAICKTSKDKKIH